MNWLDAIKGLLSVDLKRVSNGHLVMLRDDLKKFLHSLETEIEDRQNIESTHKTDSQPKEEIKMNEQLMTGFLKNNLSIEIEEDFVSYSGSGIRVNLVLNGERISTDYIVTKSD